MEIHALAHGVRTPPRKARLVAATVVGMPVNEALTVLAFTPRAAAVDVAKVIKSAAANAEHNYELNIDDLRVARIEVDGARTIKRYRPRAQGRAFTVFKRTCHMRAVVTDEPLKGQELAEERSTRRRRGAAARPEASTAGRRRTRAAAAAPVAAPEVATAEAEVEISEEEAESRRASRAARVQGAKAKRAQARAAAETATTEEAAAPAEAAKPAKSRGSAATAEPEPEPEQEPEAGRELTHESGPEAELEPGAGETEPEEEKS
jgi:large subunit ribosomal protein L22